MTKALFIHDLQHFSHFEISGHSGYAKSGHDIVCSSITTAVFTIINLFDKFGYQNHYELIQNEEDGLIIINVLVYADQIDLLIEGLIDILSNISEQYPKYLQIEIN